MIDKNKEYTLSELLDIYNMYNLDFKYYGNYQNGSLELYLKTDEENLSVFKTYYDQKTKDYLKLTEAEANDVLFKYDREVLEMDLDIVAIVVRTSDINIPTNKYKLETLNELIEKEEFKYKDKENSNDGISYIIIDQIATCSLYDGVYLFGNKEGGFINSLENQLNIEKNDLLKNNLKLILDHFNKRNKIKEI